jgi:undecaprenyl-diphosphatase
MTASPRARWILILSAACFVAAALGASLLGVAAADAALREVLVDHTPPALVTVLRVVNLAGDRYVLGPATLLLLVLFPTARRRWWIWIGLMVLAPSVEGLLKILIARPRPEGLGFGFPSGHATAAAAYFGAVAYLAGSLRRRAACLTLRTVAVGMILLVALARVVLRAHWPSDVLGGVALGLARASAAALLASARSPERIA